MNNKYKLLGFITVLVFVTLACGVDVSLPEDAIEIGELVTTEILVPQPAPGSVVDVNIKFGAGTLGLSGGGDAGFLATGTASYNVERLLPEVSLEGGDVKIQQGDMEYELTGLPNWNEVENDWLLSFNDTPMALDIDAGAFDGDFDFGGMALTDLSILTGASNVDLIFSVPNLSEMEKFTFNTGASTVYLSKLANAKFSTLVFRGGIGSYTMDFYGELTQDIIVEIDSALSAVNIRVPEGVPVVVNLNGAITSVNARGAWSGEEGIYSQPGEGYTITININLGAGTLSLEN